jgi:hypothetical protein
VIPSRASPGSGLRGIRALANRRLERYYGLQSAAKVGLEELGYDPSERVAYEPSRWLALPLGLSGWKLAEDDVFVDVGSGKGRVVVQAARHYPFERVIGVELSAALTAQARCNVERARPRLRCQRIELVTRDALRWEVPDDLTIAYLFNPFPGEVFSSLVDRLVVAVNRSGRPLRIIYVNPVEHDRLMASGQAVELPRPSRQLSRIAGISDGGLRRYALSPEGADWTDPV